jgi:hypothetical protein
MRFLGVLVAAAVVSAGVGAATGCSSSGGSGGPTPIGSSGGTPTISSNTTWEDGTELSVPTDIAAGVTVTIAPGATIHVASGVQLTIDGTLTAAGGAEAALTSDSSWAGILVDKGGTLTLTNVDIANTSVAAISVNAGAANVTYDSGTISASVAPFAIQAGAKVTTSHATVKGSLGTTRVQGELDAEYLDYDANGQDGITTESDTAVLSLQDSELHGISGQTGDGVVSYLGAQSITVAYTEIKNIHCAFHIERIMNLDVSYVNATTDSYGFMLYGSLDQGTRTVTAMNIDNELQWGIDEEDGDVNGPITITNTYFGSNAYGNVHLQTASNIHITGNATSPIANAKPR